MPALAIKMAVPGRRATAAHDMELVDVQGLRGGARLPHPIRWWRYCHDSRLALLGTGEQGLWLQVCSRGLAWL